MNVIIIICTCLNIISFGVAIYLDWLNKKLVMTDQMKNLKNCNEYILLTRNEAKDTTINWNVSDE